MAQARYNISGWRSLPGRMLSHTNHVAPIGNWKKSGKSRLIL